MHYITHSYCITNCPIGQKIY
ncbi:zinc-finger domain-containing protein [Salipaludibacillus sp. LMS25]